MQEDASKHLRMCALPHTPTCMHTQKDCVLLCAETGCLPSLEATALRHWSSAQLHMAGEKFKPRYKKKLNTEYKLRNI